jgi:hypothetical protein
MWILLISLVLATDPRYPATLRTDKLDYPPGHTVTFTGEGWVPGETVTIVLHRDPFVHGDDRLTSTADAAGRIINTEFAPARYDLGVKFRVTATGGTSGRRAQTTFTDAAVTWNGSVSTDWNTGGNWSSGTPPGIGDDVTIPANVASGRYPVVSTASANAKTLTLAIGAGTPPTVTVSAQTLTVAGNFSVNAGSVTQSGGTIKTTLGAVSITGTVNETGGTWLSSVTMTVNSGGNVNVSGSGVIHMASAIGTIPIGSIVVSAGGTITLSGGSIDTRDFTTSSGSPGGVCNQSGGTFKEYHDFRNSGTFAATAGTIEFAGSGGGNAFNAPGTNQFFNVLVDAGITTDFSANLAAAIGVRGDWTINGTATLIGTATTVTFNGTGAQAIGGASSTTFRNVTINKTSGTATLARNQTLTNGNLTVTAGTLDLSSFTMNRSAVGGSLTVSNGATLRIGGTNSFPSNYTTHTLGATSTVDYYGANQTVTDEDYGHLKLSTSGTKTMPATAVAIAGNFTMSGTPSATAASALTVSGGFNIGSGCSFGAASFAHSIGGNFVNDGTFTAATSSFTFNGSSAQTISGATATTFNNLGLNNSNGLSLSTSTTAGGTLTFTSGNITTGASTMFLASTGSVSRTSGHVVGNFRKNVATGSNVSRTYEIGSGASYTPLTVVFASVSVAGDLACSTTSGDHASIASSDVNPSKSVNRYWTMTSSGGLTFTTHSTTFTFVAGDVDAGASTANFIVRRWSGSAWSSTTIGTRTATTTQITAQSTVGVFQIGNVLSVSSSGSTFAFGTQPLNTWLAAQSSVIANDGTETETVVARISTLTAGANTWTLSTGSNGANQARAQWSTTSASGPWTDIAAYATNFTIASGLAASGTVTLYLRIQTPTSTASLNQYSSTLTVTAQ